MRGCWASWWPLKGPSLTYCPPGVTLLSLRCPWAPEIAPILTQDRKTIVPAPGENITLEQRRHFKALVLISSRAPICNSFHENDLRSGATRFFNFSPFFHKFNFPRQLNNRLHLFANNVAFAEIFAQYIRLIVVLLYTQHEVRLSYFFFVFTIFYL